MKTPAEQHRGHDRQRQLGRMVRTLVVASALLPCGLAAQDVQTAGAQPSGTQAAAPASAPATQATAPADASTSPVIQTSPGGPKQPPVEAAPNLPFAPEPQKPSIAVTAPLDAVPPQVIARGVSTPVSTGQPLRLTLDDAVRLGLQRNLTILTDIQRQRQISGLQLQAFDRLLPQLTAQGQTSTQEINLQAQGFRPQLVKSFLPPGSPPFPTIVKVSTTGAQLNVNQQIFNLPAFEIYKSARDQADVAKLDALFDRAGIVQQVAVQYLRVLSDVANMRNLQAQIQGDLELERQSLARKEAGVGTNLDLIRSRVERQQREQQLVQAQVSFEKDKVQLNRYMGLAAGQPLDLVDAVPFHELAKLPLATAREVAYGRRKDLLSLQSQLRAAERERSAIRYERLPAAKLGGFYGVLGETRGLYHGVFNAQGTIDIPIFEEARFRGDAAIADAQLSQLRSQLGSLHEDAEQQIRSAMLDVGASRDLVNVASSNVDLAAEALDETRLRYRAGVDDTLPVVRAQATLANAQSNLVSALFQFNQAKLQLARSTGVIESQFDTYLGQ